MKFSVVLMKPFCFKNANMFYSSNTNEINYEEEV